MTRLHGKNLIKALDDFFLVFTCLYGHFVVLLEFFDIFSNVGPQLLHIVVTWQFHNVVLQFLVIFNLDLGVELLVMICEALFVLSLRLLHLVLLVCELVDLLLQLGLVTLAIPDSRQFLRLLCEQLIHLRTEAAEVPCRRCRVKPVSHIIDIILLIFEHSFNLLCRHVVVCQCILKRLQVFQVCLRLEIHLQDHECILLRTITDAFFCISQLCLQFALSLLRLADLVLDPLIFITDIRLESFHFLLRDQLH